jgi:hypothetical protein
MIDEDRDQRFGARDTTDMLYRWGIGELALAKKALLD